MHVTVDGLKEIKDKWIGLRIYLDPTEIDELIESLANIRDAPDQHFHIRSSYNGEGGVGDIEIAVRAPTEEHNMRLLGAAILPG
jgi:hypothetical protein